MTSCVGMFRCMIALGAIAQMLGHSVVAGEDGLLLYYPCDEKSGTVLHDAGPYHKDGSLNAVTNGEERGVSIVCKKLGEWVPIINADGIQRKGIVPGSDSALAEGERPIVLDRDKDYAIDTTNGLIKALDGGRVELDKPFTLDFKFTNPGPTFGEDPDGRRFLHLDGHDDFVTVGALPADKELGGVTVELWIRLAKDCSKGVGILACGRNGEPPVLGLFNGGPVWILSYDWNGGVPAPLLCEKWHRFVGVWNQASADVFINGKRVSSIVQGCCDSLKILRLGSVRGWKFLAADVREIHIYNRAKTAEEIAKDAAQ